MESTLIEVVDALFGYRGRPVVQTESIRLCQGRCLGVFGPNGSGKTTLVRGLTGLLKPMNGRVIYGPRPRISYLPQHRAMDLHWPMTTLDAACLAISAYQRGGWLGGRQKQVSRWLERLDVDKLAKKSFSKLSGGQQQRALLAGALAVEPTLLVLDEPTDGLDVRSRQILVEVLNEQKERGLCTVVISHDVEELMRLADDAVCLTPADGADQPSEAQAIAPADLLARVAAIRKPV